MPATQAAPDPLQPLTSKKRKDENKHLDRFKNLDLAAGGSGVSAARAAREITAAQAPAPAKTTTRTANPKKPVKSRASRNR